MISVRCSHGFEDIFKLPKISKYIEKAKAVTTFIYAHEKILGMMKCHTKERDIVRPGVTRFATTFLTLQSLLEKTEQLKFKFVNGEWERCKDSNYVKGRSSCYTCLIPVFWDGVSRVVKVLEPLVKVLRMVYREKKHSIKTATNNLERYYQPIFEIIDEKIKGLKLDYPLHLTAYLLNLYYCYNKATIQLDASLMNGFLNCAETIYHSEFKKQDKVINHMFRIYQDKLGFCGRPDALRECEQNTDEFDPGF